MGVRIPIKTSYCPHCNENIPVHADDDYLYGSPIQVCPKCKGQYLDRHYHEAEIDGFHEKDTSKKAAVKDMLFTGGLLIVLVVLNLLSLFANRIRPMLLLFLLGAIILFFISAKDTVKVLLGIRKKELEKELLASKARLENKEYAHTLKLLGYAVPEKYL